MDSPFWFRLLEKIDPFHFYFSKQTKYFFSNDYVFALMDDSIPNKERMYKQFFGCFPNYDTFSQVFDMVTNDFGVLVLDKTIKSNKLEDKVFWFKADIMPKYRLGCPQFWEYDRLRNKAYAEQQVTQEEEDVLQQYNKGRTTNKPRITVV